MLNVLQFQAPEVKWLWGKLSKNFAIFMVKIGNKQISEITGDTNLIHAVKSEGVTLTAHPEFGLGRTHCFG